MSNTMHDELMRYAELTQDDMSSPGNRATIIDALNSMEDNSPSVAEDTGYSKEEIEEWCREQIREYMDGGVKWRISSPSDIRTYVSNTLPGEDTEHYLSVMTKTILDERHPQWGLDWGPWLRANEERFVDITLGQMEMDIKSVCDEVIGLGWARGTEGDGTLRTIVENAFRDSGCVSPEDIRDIILSAEEETDS